MGRSGGIEEVPRIYGLPMRIYLIPAKHNLKNIPLLRRTLRTSGKTEHGIQNIDYIMNIFGGRIPEVPDTLPGVRDEDGC